MTINPQTAQHLSRVLALCLAMLSYGIWPACAVSPPQVVATIKPLHSLVAAVMKDIAHPYLLLAGGASPHNYALKPSDARALSKADLIFWIGPSLERSIEKPIRSLAGKAVVIAVSDAPGLTVHHIRQAGAWEGHAHAHGDHHIDPHLWLDPRNAKQIVRLTAQRLAEMDGARRDQYAANRDLALIDIDRASRETAAILAPVSGVPYIVFHDAFQYFEKRFGTSAIGSVTLTPDRRPGARRVSRIRARIAANHARCVFAEPQFPPSLVETILRGTSAHAGTIDPIGVASEGYGGMLRAIAKGMRQCLER